MAGFGDLDQLGLRLVALCVDGHLVLAGGQQTEVIAILNWKQKSICFILNYIYPWWTKMNHYL